MTRQSIGRVTPLSKGAFNSNNTYERLDIITYNGSSYMAKQQTVGNLPTNTEYWQLIAEKGDPGTTDYEELEHKPDLTVYALKSESGYKLDLEMNSSTFVITPKLYNKNNVLISTGASIDLPMESVVVSGSYDNTNKKIVLTLKNGSTIDVPVGDLIGGLQSEINASNKISSDFVDDTDKINKFMSAEEKTKLAGIANNANNYVLPDATKNSKGGVQVGDGLNVLNGVISYDSTEDLEEAISNLFAMTPDYNDYAVGWNSFSTSTAPTMTKLKANENLVCTPSTDKAPGYSNYPLSWLVFKANGFIDNEGEFHLTAIEGDKNFGDTESTIKTFSYKGVTYLQDVFMIGRKYWQYVDSDSTYDTILHRKYVPVEGVNPFCVKGKPYWAIAAYEAGYDSNGKIRSLKGLVPGGQRNNPVGKCSASMLNSHNNQITNFHTNRGSYYSGMTASELSHIQTTFWLKYATKNSQSIMAGCTGYDYQYTVAAAESNVTRVKLTTSQANNLMVGSSVSVGDNGETPTTYDRVNGYVHKYADSARIISIEEDEEDNTYSYVNLDCDPFTSTVTTFIKTMPWRTGFSDMILSRDGSPNHLTNSKNPVVIDGIELMTGGYEVIANIVMDYDATNHAYDIYTTNDTTKYSSTDATIRSTYNKSSVKTQCNANDSWNYIKEMGFDFINNVVVASECGGTNSSTSTGFCDGIYASSSSGTREFLAFGYLGYGAGGLSCGYCNCGLGLNWWSYLARLSCNALGGS